MKSGTERKEERGGAFGAGRRRVCTGGERDEIENEDAGSKWNTFLDKIRPPPTAEEVVGGMKGEAI